MDGVSPMLIFLKKTHLYLCLPDKKRKLFLTKRQIPSVESLLYNDLYNTINPKCWLTKYCHFHTCSPQNKYIMDQNNGPIHIKF